MLRFTTALCLLAPAFAQAQCLTADSLDAGIAVEFGNGNMSYIERTETGTILDAYDDQDGYFKEIIHLETLDGVIELNRVSHEKDQWQPYSSASITYGFDSESMAPYPANNRGGGPATRVRPDYRDRPISFSWSTYESDPLVVGDCTYETTRVFISEFDAQRGNLYTRDVTYLPELGFGIQRANSYYNLPIENAVVLSMTSL